MAVYDFSNVPHESELVIGDLLEAVTDEGLITWVFKGPTIGWLIAVEEEELPVVAASLKPAVIPSGALIWGEVNIVTTTATFTIPQANTVLPNTYLDIYVPKRYAGIVVTVNRSGSDLFNNGTTDTQLVLTFEGSGTQRIISDGISVLEV